MKTYLITLAAAAGLLAGCERSIESASYDFNSLPEAVQKSVRAEAPDAEIARVSNRTENGMEVYEIEFRQPDANPKMVVAADGRVLSSPNADEPAGAIRKALTPTGAVGTKFSALPQDVQRAIQQKAPDAEIADIAREEENGRAVYKIEFKNSGVNPTMRVTEDGTVVQGMQ